MTGLSVITLVFKRGTDIIKARQMVQERLALAYSLPNVARPPVILQPLSAVNRFMMIGLSSDTIDPTELSLLARWTIKPRLLGVSGVANVAIWGQRLRQLHVQIDPDRLRDAELVQDDIIAATGDALWVSPLSFLRASAPGAGGWIDNANQRLQVEHFMPIDTPSDMAEVPIASPRHVEAGTTLPIGAVTEVSFDHPLLIGDAIINNGNGLILVVEKFPGTGTLDVTERVERALSEMSRGLPGVRIDPHVFRLASYVEDSISNLAWVFAFGGVLVALVIGLFLFNWRSTLIGISSILLSLSAAVVVLYLAGATINTMVLAGLVLAIGVVIDDAVVDLDRLSARLRGRRWSRSKSVITLIRDTALETRGAAIYAVLIVALALVPIFFMSGMSGAFLEPLASAYLLAVAASMVVALTVTPALQMMLIRKSEDVGQPLPASGRLQKNYEQAVGKIARRPRVLLALVVIVMAVGVGISPLLGESLIPRLQERELLVNWTTPPGTSHAETYRITSRVVAEIQSLPGVRGVGALIGRAVTGDRAVGINSSELWVSMDPAADYGQTVAAIRETVNGYPGVENNLQTYLREKVSEALTGESDAIVVRIYGPERDILRQTANDIRSSLAGISGLVDLRAETQIEEPHIQVKVDLDSAARAGIKPGDVRRSAATIFSGIVVGYLFKEQKIFEVVVWGAPETRQSLSDLNDLWIDRRDRSQVRLRDVAEVSIESTPTLIRHESIAPYVDVVSGVAGRDAVTVAEEVKERLENMQFPLEYRAELLGEYAEWENIEDQTLRLALAVLIGIFLLLQACFRSWRLAFVGFLALPVSFAGGMVATLVAGGMISLGSIVGFLAVLGLAARSSVLLIDHYLRMEGQEGVKFGRDLVLRGAGERMLPGLTSSLAIIAAMLPMLFLGQVPGLEIVQPMAVVIIGGLTASTLFTLYALPVLFMAARSKSEPEPEFDF